jgi:hypothetical protein
MPDRAVTFLPTIPATRVEFGPDGITFHDPKPWKPWDEPLEWSVACPKCRSLPGWPCQSIKHAGGLALLVCRTHKKRRTALLMGAQVLTGPRVRGGSGFPVRPLAAGSSRYAAAPVLPVDSAREAIANVARQVLRAIGW